MLLSRIGAGRINSILKTKHVGLITEETLKYCKISLTSNFAICNLLLSLFTLLSTRFGLKQNTISKLWNKHWTQNIVCRHCNAINREFIFISPGIISEQERHCDCQQDYVKIKLAKDWQIIRFPSCRRSGALTS